MTQAIAYLSYDGTCADAVRFIAEATGATLELMMRGGDSPMKDMMPPQFHDRILHARLVLPGGGMIYAGDCPVGTYRGIHGVGLTLDYDTVEEAQRVFAKLSEGGTVSMPMQPAFWAKTWGMCTDRFGTPWIVNGEQIPI